MEGKDLENFCKAGPSSQLVDGPFAIFSRDAGFSLLANPSSLNTTTVTQHNAPVPFSNPNPVSNRNSETNSQCMVPNINPSAVTDPNHPSSAFFDAGSSVAATPPPEFTAKEREGSTLEARQRKRGNFCQHGNHEDAGACAASQMPTHVSERKRGPRAGKKAQLHALGSGAQNFTPHVLTIPIGQDVCSRIMTFSTQGPWSVCIFSASGTISNAAIRHAGVAGGSVTYEGHFEILSLSGSFVLTENSVARRTGGLSVSLAGPDGRVIGGVVVGLLMAASPVQVVLGTFFTGNSNAVRGVEPISRMRSARVGAGMQTSVLHLNNYNLGGSADGMEQPIRYSVPLPFGQPVNWGGFQFNADSGDDTDRTTSVNEPQS